MKHNILLIIPALFALCSCGGGENASSQIDSNISENSVVTSSENLDDLYSVEVLKSDGSPANEKGVKVRWCEGSYCYAPIAVNENGVAYFEGEDGKNYDVHLTLPYEYGYTYNANIYFQNSENKHMTINLTDVKHPLSGDGTMYVNSDTGALGPYIISEGAYSVEVNGYLQDSQDIDYIYYSFKPTRPGIYKVESYSENVKGYDTVVAGFGNTPTVMFKCGEDDDSGEGLNFYYEFAVTPDTFQTNDSGASECITLYSIGVGAKTDCYFDFELSYDRPYKGDTPATKVEVSEKLIDFTNQNGTLTNIDLDGSKVAVYNKNDRFYHLDEENGPVIVAYINEPNLYVNNALSNMEAVGQSLRTQGGSKDYGDFIQAYGAKCNEDGVYPLTEEMRIFLSEFAQSQEYFNPQYGWITGYFEIGYAFGEQAEFLYDCAYYNLSE